MLNTPPSCGRFAQCAPTLRRRHCRRLGASAREGRQAARAARSMRMPQADAIPVAHSKRRTSPAPSRCRASCCRGPGIEPMVGRTARKPHRPPTREPDGAGNLPAGHAVPTRDVRVPPNGRKSVFRDMASCRMSTLWEKRSCLPRFGVTRTWFHAAKTMAQGTS